MIWLLPTVALSLAPPSGPERYGGALPLSPSCTWVFCTSPSRRVIQSIPQDDHQHHGQRRMAAGTDDLLPQGRLVQSCALFIYSDYSSTNTKRASSKMWDQFQRGEGKWNMWCGFIFWLFINQSTAYLSFTFICLFFLIIVCFTNRWKRWLWLCKILTWVWSWGTRDFSSRSFHMPWQVRAAKGTMCMWTETWQPALFIMQKITEMKNCEEIFF